MTISGEPDGQRGLNKCFGLFPPFDTKRQIASDKSTRKYRFCECLVTRSKEHERDEY